MTRTAIFKSSRFQTTQQTVITLPTPDRVSRNNRHLPGGVRTENEEVGMTSVEGVPFMNGSPYIPASGFRGALRNIGADTAINLYCKSRGIERRAVIDYRSQNMLYVGGGGWVDSAKPSFHEANRLRDENIVVGTFGVSDPTFIGGVLKVGNLILAEDSKDVVLVRRNVVRQDPVSRRPELYNDLTDPETRTRQTEFWGALDSIDAEYAPEIESLKKREDESRKIGDTKDADLARKERGVIAKTIEARRKGLIKENPLLSSTNIRQLQRGIAIPAGTSFTSELRLVNATDDQIGFMIRVMKTFKKNPILGGLSASGAGGMIDFDYSISLWDDETDDFVLDSHSLWDLGEEAQKCLDVFNRNLPNFHIIYTPEKKKSQARVVESPVVVESSGVIEAA